jgi:hypothetical protein
MKDEGGRMKAEKREKRFIHRLLSAAFGRNREKTTTEAQRHRGTEAQRHRDHQEAQVLMPVLARILRGTARIPGML